MKPLSLVGAVVGGVVGALVWTAVAYWFNIEIGYVAWALGGLVGYGSYALGGRGVASGCTCVVVTLIAIFAGKCLTVSTVLKAETYNQLYAFLTPQAEQFTRIRSESEYAEFMSDFGYTNAPDSGQVPAEELKNFTALVVPMLRELAETKPTLHEWKENPTAQIYVAQLTADVPVVDLVIESLGIVDLIFLVLGVGTAFKVGMANREDGESRG